MAAPSSWTKTAAGLCSTETEESEETGTRSPNDSALLFEDATEESSCCIDWAARKRADEAVEVVDTLESSSSIDLTGDANNRVAADAMPPESFLVDEAALTAVRMAWRFCVVSQPLDNL